MAKSLKYWRSACLAENATAANHYRAANKKGVRELLFAGGYKQTKDGFSNGTHNFGKPQLMEVNFINPLDMFTRALTGQIEEKELHMAEETEPAAPAAPATA